MIGEVSHEGYDYVHGALDGGSVRTQTIRQLLTTLNEQHARLNAQLANTLSLHQLGLDSSADSSRLGHPVESTTMDPVCPVIRCFGSLCLSIGNRTVDSWRSGKARALFEYLIAHRGRPTSRDALIQALWPDPDALASGTSLKVAVHALRQILAELRASNPSNAFEVVVRESSYQLLVPDVWIDVEEFERCCKLGGQLEAHGRTQEALSLYERAAELYRGDFLVDNWDEWAVFRREGLKDQYMFVLARLADAALQTGQFGRCIHLCRKLLEQDNCREDSFRMLMLCHSQLGQPGRVRRWYDLCVKTLRNELDVEPDDETEQVFRMATSEPRPPSSDPSKPLNGYSGAINSLVTQS